MDDPLQHSPLRLVAQHDRAHGGPVELAVGGQHVAPERGHNPGQPVGPGRDHLA